jgi:Ca2+-dependent lipid-binding protein
MLAGGDIGIVLICLVINILDAAIGVLQVTIYSARGIRNPEKFSGTPDPYVVLSINSGRELDRTEIQHGTATPRWSETKSILINSLNDALSLQIFDYNEIRKDRLLGTANFDLKQLEQHPEHENVSKQIMYNAKVRGEVVFDVRYYPVLLPKKLDDGTQQPPPETITGIVAFTVHQAKDLDARKSLIGTVNPYAVFLLNDKEIHVSKKLKRTNNPVWEEHVEILVHNRMNCRLGVMIKDDRDLGTDIVVGSYQISLTDFIERIDAQQDWFTLANAVSGKVRMEVKWKPVDMPGAIQGSGGYVTPIGALRFHFKQAKDVRNVEAVTGKSDPYVRVTVSNFEKARTVHINNDLNPVWDEVLYVPVHHTREQYVLEVMDYQSHSKDRSLGYTQLNANEFISRNEDGEYLEFAEKKLRVEPLFNDRKEAKGNLYYTVSFYPCVNVADPEEEEEVQKAEAKIQELPDSAADASGVKKPEVNGASQPTPLPELPKASASASSQIDDGSRPSVDASRSSLSVSSNDKGGRRVSSSSSITGRAEPPKVHLTPEELLKYNSGIVIFNIIEGELSNRDCYLEVLFDDYAFPAFVSTKARSEHQRWDEVGDTFVRELDFSRITMRVRTKLDHLHDLSDVIGTLTGDTIEVLKTCLNNPHDYVVKGSGNGSYKIKVSMKYIPVEIQLDPSESINNMGDLRVELIEGKNLPAADRSGYSDPYCVFTLNGEKVFKSKIIKKTLNPTWDENFEVTVPSRTAVDFYLECFDWDLGAEDDFLGKAVLNLTDLEPFQQKSMTIALDGQSGEIKLKLLFKPGYITRTRRGTSTFGGTFGGGTGRMVTGLAASPAKIVGGGVKGVGKGVGATASGIGGAASFVKRGFARRKALQGEDEGEGDLTPRDLEIAKAAAASGGGIKGTSSGVQFAVTGDDKHTPLNTDPDQLNSQPENPPSTGSSGNTKEMSVSGSNGAETGLFQIAVVEGQGFPSGRDIRVILKTPQKEFFKSKAVKSSEPTW